MPYPHSPLLRQTALLCILTITSACGGGGSGSSTEPGNDLVSSGAVESSGSNTTETPEVNKPPPDELVTDCSGIIAGANPADDFLCAHNGVRAAVKPRPTKALEALTWDEDLATVARAHAEQCEFEHNPDRALGYAGSVGENLFLSSHFDASPEDAVASWSAEADSYSHDDNRCAKGKICGHYTQVVWSETTRLGCGQASCPDMEVKGRRWPNALFMVCNYSPAGNVAGQSPY